MSIFHTAVDYFQRGGVVMWPLLLCSIIAVAIAVERWIFFRKEDSGEIFRDKFCKYIENDDWTNAKKLADATQGEAAKLATIVMARHGRFERLESFVESRAERAITKFEDYLSYLGVIVNLSPILGLLGTITGMIGAFSAMNVRGTNPLAVTAGIGEALITTVFGLCISINAICFHTYFMRRLDRICLDIEEISRTLLEAIAKDLDEAGR